MSLVCVLDDHREHDRGKPTRTEPADEHHRGGPRRWAAAKDEIATGSIKRTTVRFITAYRPTCQLTCSRAGPSSTASEDEKRDGVEHRAGLLRETRHRVLAVCEQAEQRTSRERSDEARATEGLDGDPERQYRGGYGDDLPAQASSVAGRMPPAATTIP